MTYQDIRSCYIEQDDPPAPCRQWRCPTHNVVFQDGDTCDEAEEGGEPCAAPVEYDETTDAGADTERNPIMQTPTPQTMVCPRCDGKWNRCHLCNGVGTLPVPSADWQTAALEAYRAQEELSRQKAREEEEKERKDRLLQFRCALLALGIDATPPCDEFLVGEHSFRFTEIREYGYVQTGVVLVDTCPACGEERLSRLLGNPQSLGAYLDGNGEYSHRCPGESEAEPLLLAPAPLAPLQQLTAALTAVVGEIHQRLDDLESGQEYRSEAAERAATRASRAQDSLREEMRSEVQRARYEAEQEINRLKREVERTKRGW